MQEVVGAPAAVEEAAEAVEVEAVVPAEVVRAGAASAEVVEEAAPAAEAVAAVPIRDQFHHPVV